MRNAQTLFQVPSHCCRLESNTRGLSRHGLAAVMRYMKLAHLFGGIEVGSASGRLARPEAICMIYTIHIPCKIFIGVPDVLYSFIEIEI